MRMAARTLAVVAILIAPATLAIAQSLSTGDTQTTAGNDLPVTSNATGNATDDDGSQGNTTTARPAPSQRLGQRLNPRVGGE